MAGQLLLINPRKRRARKANPARRRARAANPRRRRRTAVARRPNPVGMFLNPRRRARRRNPSRAIHRRVMRRGRRRNPIASGLIEGMFKDAAIGAVGSLGVDMIMGQVQPQLPATMQTGYAYVLLKAAATVALGIFGKKFAGPAAITAAQGALTTQLAVALYDSVSGSVTTDTPASLSGLGNGRKMRRGGQRMGYYTAAQQVPGSRGMNTHVPQIRSLGMYLNGVKGNDLAGVSEMGGHVYR